MYKFRLISESAALGSRCHYAISKPVGRGRTFESACGKPAAWCLTLIQDDEPSVVNLCQGCVARVARELLSALIYAD
jgi:hypothetical protein